MSELDLYQEGCPSRRIGGISQELLTQTLRSVERDGLVVRAITAEGAVKAEYRLSESGRTLNEPLRRWNGGLSTTSPA